MKPELDKQLCDKYPKIFVNRGASAMESCMHWGLAVGDGWYNLLDKTCELIQSYIDSRERQNKWIKENNLTIQDARPIPPQVVAAQVKEKFGGLRFYVDGGDEYCRGVIDLAESLSYTICEVCGNPGKERSGGWIRVMCDQHEVERQQKLRDRKL